jgi:dUTP pyrophosphatase
MVSKIVLKYKKEHPDARIDYPAMEDDAGYDVYAVEEVFVPLGEKREVNIGLAFEIPKGYYLTLETRSGHGVVKGLRMHRSIIDAGFRGCFTVVVYNHNHALHHNPDSFCKEKERYGYLVKKGEKIGQLILHKCHHPILKEVDKLSSSKRGMNNWGSTNK